MNDTVLDERIHALAAAIPAPVVPAYDDLLRGRRLRQRRRRAGIAAGSVAAAAVVVAGVALGAAPSDRAADPEPRPLQPAAALPVPEARDGALVQQLDRLGGEEGSITVRELRAVADALVDRISGHLGWLSVGAADSWQATGADTCPAGWTCEDAAVRGADRARWAESGTVHQLVVDLDGRVSLFTVNQADARPSDVAWATP